MIQLNLLPDIKKEFIKSQQTKNTVISVSILVTIGSLGLAALLFVYVNFIQQLQLNSVNGSITDKTNQLKNISNIDQYLTIQNQLQALPALHQNKPIYSRLFSFLPTLNPSSPNNVTLSALQVDNTQQTITFTGTTSTFEAFNVFVDTLRNAEVSFKTSPEDSAQATKEKMFSTVAIQSSALGRNGNQTVVNFVVQGTYKPEVFSAQSYSVNVSVPSIQNTQASQSSTQVFSGSAGGGQ